MSSRRMSLLPRATLHSDSEQLGLLLFMPGQIPPCIPVGTKNPDSLLSMNYVEFAKLVNLFSWAWTLSFSNTIWN
jgi:hypothetical protein